MQESQQLEASSSRRQKTRERLIEAALEVFAEVGVDAAPVELITERAGYTRGAFYSNFESKNELFVALAERENTKRMEQLQLGIDVVLPRLDAGQLTSLPREQKLETVTNMVAEFLRLQGEDRQWYLIDAEFRIQALRNREFGRYLAQHDEAMKEQLARVIVEGLARVGLRFVVEPTMAVRLIVAAYQSVSEHSVLMGSTIPASQNRELHSTLGTIVTLFTARLAGEAPRDAAI